jgi:tetratricopeptide (TPR) repeat protein
MQKHPQSICSAIFLLIVFTLTCFGQDSPAPSPSNGCGGEDYAAQIKKYTGVIKEGGRHSEWYLYRGRAYAGIYDHVNALKDLYKALELNSGSDEAHMAIAEIYAHRGNNVKAVAAVTRAIELNPANSRAYIERARLRLEERSFDQQSLSDLAKSVTFDARNPEAFYVRGRLLSLMGRKQESQDDYFRAGQVLTGLLEGTMEDECKSHFYVQRGWVNIALQRADGAIDDYNRAIETENTYFLARYYRGTLMLRLKKESAAISDFDKAIELNPTYADSYKERAFAYDRLGAKDKAAADRRKYEELKEVK